jgi:2'-5' RNA ligase
LLIITGDVSAKILIYTMFKRLFVAVNLPDDVKREISLYLDRIKNENERLPVKWCAANNFHLTLYFLGEVDEEKIEDINGVIRETTEKYKGKNFELETGGVGAFPDLRRPKVVFLKIKEVGAKNLTALQRYLAGNLEIIGFREGNFHPWTPHLTLGRIKADGQKLNIPEEEAEKQVFKIKSVELMESCLAPRGPEYKMVKIYPLN